MKRKSNKKKRMAQIYPHMADEYATNMKDIAQNSNIPTDSFDTAFRHFKRSFEDDTKQLNRQTSMLRAHSTAHMMLSMVSWTKTKQIYRFSDSLMNEFFENRLLNFPISSLHMPFPTVYFELESPILLDEFKIMGAYFTFGDAQKDGKERCCLTLLYFSPSDEFKEANSLTFGTFVASETKMKDVANEVAQSVLQYGFVNKDYATMLELFEVFFMCAAYISSEQPDIIMKEKVSGQYHSKSRSGKIRKTSVQNWDVGYRIVKERKTSSIASTSSNNTAVASYHVRPHIRKAHWHTYWTGPGRTIPKVRWVRDTDVNRNLSDSVAVVHLIDS